jgi:hypothetical protein
MAGVPDEWLKEWAEFDALGEAAVRQNVAKHVYGDSRIKSVNQWLAFRASQDSADSRRETLRVANEANDLARSANAAASEANTIARNSAAAAKRSAAAAWTSNIIAAAALIAAIVAIVLSTIGKHWFS